MKKLFLITVFISALTLNSCSSDSQSAKTINGAELLGVWKLKSHSLDGEQLPNSGEIYKFTSNHRVQISYPQDGNYSEYGDWTLTGSSLVIHNDDADPGNEYYYLQITELTSNTLSWKTNISGEGLLEETYSR